eukprot:3384063-Rhodomonas_salina.2
MIQVESSWPGGGHGASGDGGGTAAALSPRFKFTFLAHSVCITDGTDASDAGPRFRRGGSTPRDHPEMKYKKPQFQDNLYQECGFFCWISHGIIRVVWSNTQPPCHPCPCALSCPVTQPGSPKADCATDVSRCTRPTLKCKTAILVQSRLKLGCRLALQFGVSCNTTIRTPGTHCT